jgi:hypothetical protein
MVVLESGTFQVFGVWVLPAVDARAAPSVTEVPILVVPANVAVDVTYNVPPNVAVDVTFRVDGVNAPPVIVANEPGLSVQYGFGILVSLEDG